MKTKLMLFFTLLVGCVITDDPSVETDGVPEDPEPVCDLIGSYCVCPWGQGHPTECGCYLEEGTCWCPDPVGIVGWPASYCTDDICITDLADGSCWCNHAPSEPECCANDELDCLSPEPAV